MSESEKDIDLGINPSAINDTESRQITLLLTMLKHPEGLSFDEIRSLMPEFYNNPNSDSDQRKIRRDFANLNELGFNACYNSYQNKYTISVDSAESKLKFSEDELYEISLSLIQSDASGEFSPEVYSLSQKIFGSNWSLYPFFPNSKKELEPRESPNPILDTLLHAIKSKQAISIRYERNYGKPEDKEIDPIQIFRRNSVDFYLYAWDRQSEDYKTYVIPCIRECSRLDKPHKQFHPPVQNFNLTNPFLFGKADPMEIRIGIDEKVSDLFLANLKDCESDWVDSKIRITLINPEPLFPLLFRFSRYLYTIEPEELRLEFQKFLRKVHSLHAGT